MSQRNALQDVIRESADYRQMEDEASQWDWYFCIEPDDTTDAVIAHLWDHALHPVVLEAVARRIHIEGLEGAQLRRATRDSLEITEANRRQAFGAVEAVLELLIGDKPKEVQP